MRRRFTILHISDLHRSASDPITNEELVSALVSDRDRYIHEDPKISSPDAIVVSGDIIQGVPLGVSNFQAELESQYATAEAFLDELTNRFLSGDRSRLILLPGNHDVDWNTAFSAMEVIDPNGIENFSQKLHAETSKYRWDWKTRTAYRITNEALYTKRLEQFWRFFERFYSGINGLLKVRPGSDANFYSLYEGKIAVAAFNSCDGNDCFAFHGLIRKEVIAQSHLDLQDSGIFDLLVAAWHHNIEGTPYRTDYMDVEIVKGMIGRGFRLGLYGHQHRVQTIPFQIFLPDRERMAVVSAGSLCAGKNDLPLGTFRQYNLLEIAEDFKSVIVHVREMSVANLFSKGRLLELGGSSFAELGWDLPRNPQGLPDDTQSKRRIEKIESAERALKDGNPFHAIQELEGMELPEYSYEREIYLAAAIEVKDWEKVINLTIIPVTISELVQRVNALIEVRRFSDASGSLSLHGPELGLPEPIKIDLQRRIKTFEGIKS